MNEDFLNEFISTRDDTLTEIKTSLYKWNNFITYWANILDKYSIDNVLNLYSYNSNGKIFMTFDEWNSKQIARRIKPKSKGIPIFVDNKKIYVFDIKQTYGRDYNKWNYKHYVDNAILKYYQTELGIKNDDSKSFDENFYDIIYKKSLLKIFDDYKDTNAEELEFIAKTMASLFLSKANFNIYNLPNVYEKLNLMENEEILKCMQISNRETINLYNSFIEDTKSLEDVQNRIQSRLLFGFERDFKLDDIYKNKLLSSFEKITMFNYEVLESIYNRYYNKYSVGFKKRVNSKETKAKLKNTISVEQNEKEEPLKEQLSLFVSREEELANKICDIFNSFDTKYKNTFEVHNVELQRWEQIKSKKRNLSICITSPLAENFGEDSFTYFNKDKTDEKKLNDGIVNNYFLQQLYKDKDFSISFTPSIIHIFWHNFDDKQFDMNISSTKMISQSEIDREELEKIDDDVSSIYDEKNIDELEQFVEELLTNIKSFDTKIAKDDNGKIKGVIVGEEPMNLQRFFVWCLEDLNEDDRLQEYEIKIKQSLSEIRLEQYKKIVGKKIIIDNEEYTVIDIRERDDDVGDDAVIQNNKNETTVEPVDYVIHLLGQNTLESSVLNYKNEYPALNYRISDNKVDNIFGAKTRFEDNVRAIKLLKKLENENRNATLEEQEILSYYVGWGGIADAFDERKNNWKDEREELKLLLNDEEYEAAAHSTLSSFYTPNIAIDGIYKVLKKFGFEKGNILEPSCGIGNFFGRIPEEFEKSKLYGIELDSISGRIAKKLYPNAKIEIIGFENSKVSDELFDIAIGNVPFGNNTVYDKRYKDRFLIHDYFFQKSLDKVRSGGIIAFITTDGTLDKKDTKVREYIAKRAEFLGAIRLPNNTFKGNANARVTSDIIFLKKREELKQNISDERWIYTAEYDDGIEINSYYIENPDMMLGKMELHSAPFGYDNTLSPVEEDINVLMDKAINNLPSDVYEKATFIDAENNDYEVLDADDNIKNNAFTIINKDGKDVIYQRILSSLVPYSIQEGMTAKRIIGLCKVKNALRKVFDVQLHDKNDEELKIAQEELSREYDDFCKKYGYINDSVNARAFDNDPDYYLLTSIENKISKDDEDDKPKYSKGDIFTKRTIRKSKAITKADTAEDALRYSLNNRGCVDFEYMKTLYSKNDDEIIEELGGLIYQDPEKINDFNNGWVMASEYLSGNVKQKLNYVKTINENGKYDKNIEALERVQPLPLEYDEISVKLGSTWIPEDVYHDFCCELLDIPSWNKSHLKIKYVKEANTWLFQASGLYGYGVKNTTTWGTQRADALSIIKNTLNLQSVTIYDTLEDDRKVVNSVETANAREKQEHLTINIRMREWEKLLVHETKHVWKSFHNFAERKEDENQYNNLSKL